jgi:DNA-binding CsgD family transcriptional regulator
MNQLLASSIPDLELLGEVVLQQIAEAFSILGKPIALLGRSGRVIHLNSQFEKLVGDGVLVRNRRLASWQSDADRALSNAIYLAVDGGVSPKLSPKIVLPRMTGRPLVAEVIPVSVALNALHPVLAIVTLADLERNSSPPCSVLLEQAFGLTPAEARLASQIVEGKTLSDISKDGGIARETLRTRLKYVFQKTRTRRQAELALLLSRITRQAA